jgi:hypothetical protein
MSGRAQPLLIVIILLVTTALLIPSCTDNQASGASDPNAEDAPPVQEEPEDGHPKLSFDLNELILAAERGEVEEFTRQTDIELVDGYVTVIIECVPGQCEAAAEAATRAGAREVRVSDNFNWVRAVVPITSLAALSEDESISSVRLPWYAVDE